MFVQIEFVSPRIRAYEVIGDIKKAVRNASINLLSRHKIKVGDPIITDDLKVVFHMNIPLEELKYNFSLGNHLRGISSYLLSECDRSYCQYLVGTRLFNYTEIPASEIDFINANPHKTYKLDRVAIRLVEEPPLYSDKEVHSPRDVVDLFKDEMKQYDREVAVVVNLNNKLQPINMNIISVGSVANSIVEPREVFKSAILSNATHIMMLHNHPSGQIKPSLEDDELTKRIKDVGNLMIIPLIDHIIIGDGCYYSYKEQGMI